MQKVASKWYTEYVNPTLLLQRQLKSLVYTGHTPFQVVEVLETVPFGRTLVLDGKTQSAELDEFVYHEALVQPPMICHEGPKSVFIAGGGEGATLREALTHKTVQKAVMVDIDGDVVELCKKHLQAWHQGSFDDPRAELVITDAKEYLVNYKGTFDIVIMDIPDPLEGGPAWLLFTKEFYKMVATKLSPDGVFVAQAGPTDMGMTWAFTAVNNTLRQVFPQVFSYHAPVPSFGSTWGFAMASRRADPLKLTPQEIDKRIAARVSKPLRMYDGAAHAGLFALPKWLRKEIASEKRVITEKEPLFVP